MNRNTYELTIRVDIRQVDQASTFEAYARGLHIEEKLTITGDSFLELAQILGRFHELAQAIERERGKQP